MKKKVPLEKDHPLNKDPPKDHPLNKDPQIELSYICNSEENHWGRSATEFTKRISQQNVEVECGLKCNIKTPSSHLNQIISGLKTSIDLHCHPSLVLA